MRTILMAMVAVMVAGCAQNTDLFTRQTPTTPITVNIHNGPEMPAVSGYAYTAPGVPATQPVSVSDITTEDGALVVTLPPGTRNQVVKIWIDNGVETRSDSASEATQDIRAEVQAKLEFIYSLLSQLQRSVAESLKGDASSEGGQQEATPSVTVDVDSPPATKSTD